MSDLDRLRYRYMRLMRAYPRWYRRERERELVTTLLDDAAPGQQRPSRIDTVDLLVGGLRARFNPPRTLSAWGVCVLTALFVASGAASAAALASDGPLPTQPAIAIATVAMNQPPDQVVSKNEPPMRIDNVALHYSGLGDSVPDMMMQARDRLAAVGWQVGPLQDNGVLGFTATSQEFNIGVFSSSPTTFEVFVSKRVSALIMVSVPLGGLAGLLAGWMIGVSALQRYRRHLPGRRKHISQIAAPYFISTTYWMVMTFTFVMMDLAGGIDSVDIQAPLLFIAFPMFGPFFTTASIIFGLAALGLTATPRRHRRQTQDPPYPAVGSLT